MGNFPEVDHIINSVLAKFQCGDPEMKNFRYCGKEVVQYEDFTIIVTCRATTDKLKPIRVESGRKAADPLNESEITQMKSVAGSLQWISRQARPELSYRTSKIQQMAANGTVADIKYANKVVRYARSTADRGLTFKPGRGVMVGKDYTIFALQDGIVQFESDKKAKFISVN